jgi:hypothetical protein
MSWLKKIRVSCLLLVVLTVLGFHAEAETLHSTQGRYHQEQVSTQHAALSLSDYQWINAPLPERPEELLFIEESEDKQQYWILELGNRQLTICISILFGQPDPGFELEAVPFTGSLPITQLSTSERLSSLQIFRI